MAKSAMRIAPSSAMTTPAQIERLGEHLRKLRLLKSGERLEALLQQAASNELPYAEFLEQILGEEVAAKTTKNIAMRTAMARFPFVKPLETFDFAQMNPNCIERRDSTVAPQALYLMNNGMVDQLAERFAERVKRDAGENVAAQVESVYWIALSRPPTKEERQLGETAIRELSKEWPGALKTYCRAIMNSAGFLYVD